MSDVKLAHRAEALLVRCMLNLLRRLPPATAA